MENVNVAYPLLSPPPGTNLSVTDANVYKDDKLILKLLSLSKLREAINHHRGFKLYPNVHLLKVYNRYEIVRQLTGDCVTH